MSNGLLKVGRGNAVKVPRVVFGVGTHIQWGINSADTDRHDSEGPRVCGAPGAMLLAEEGYTTHWEGLLLGEFLSA